MSDKLIQILTTAATEVEARTIAQALVERRLAACVQVVGPIESHYRWKDKVERSQEWLCLVKTRSSHRERVEQAIGELHSYDLPEIVVMPIDASAAYLAWALAQID